MIPSVLWVFFVVDSVTEGREIAIGLMKALKIPRIIHPGESYL